jgi:deazaflavin-dependent oxidoreductase (nitroreductase family)
VPVAALISFVQRLSHRPWFGAVLRPLVPLDRQVSRWTKGRVSAFGGGWLIPSLLLTTTGRKTGQPRSQPLLFVRDGDAYVVIGSNWGQTHQPAWSGNLLANPDATVTVGGKIVPVRATLATGAERERLFGLLRKVWPAYDTYVQRAGGRDIRVFRLAPR